MQGCEGALVPLDEVARRVRAVVHVEDRSRPTAQRDVLEARDRGGGLHPDQRAGSEPGGAAYLRALAVDRAGNQKEFLGALAAWHVPSLNFVYADKEGTIGWVAAALTPIRPKHDGLLPVPGDGGFRWSGFLPVADLPQNFNPKSGWLATANHNILPPGYQHEISYEFAPLYRFLRVKSRLQAQPRFKLDDFKSIQHDEVSIPGQTLARLIKTVEIEDEAVKPFAGMFAEWDGNLSRDSRVGPLYALWLQELQREFVRAQVPKELLRDVSLLSGLPVMLKALEKPDKSWFGADPHERRDELLRADKHAGVRIGQVLAGQLEVPGILRDADRGVVGRVAWNLVSSPRGGDGSARLVRWIRARLREVMCGVKSTRLNERHVTGDVPLVACMEVELQGRRVGARGRFHQRHPEDCGSAT